MQAYETEKKDAGITRDRCSSFWRLISHCLIYTVLAFFVAIVIYYVAMRASTRPELMPSSGKHFLSLVLFLVMEYWHQRADEGHGNPPPRYPGVICGQRQSWKTAR